MEADTETETEKPVDQLSPKEFQRAYEKWCGEGTHYDWWDSIYEMKTSEGEERGFDIRDIRFSGFWSQGDGACWTGYIHLDEVLKWADKQETNPFTPHQMNLLRAATENNTVYNPVKVQSEGRYCHQYTTELQHGIETYAGDTPMRLGFFEGILESVFMEEYFEPHREEIEKVVLGLARDYAGEIYKALEEEYEYLTSEEYFREQAEANDWKFDEEGEIV